MKTLKELWIKNKRRPFRARAMHWSSPSTWYAVIGFAPGGAKDSIGYMNTGHSVGYHPTQYTWEELKTPESMRDKRGWPLLK